MQYLGQVLQKSWIPALLLVRCKKFFLWIWKVSNRNLIQPETQTHLKGTKNNILFSSLTVTNSNAMIPKRASHNSIWQWAYPTNCTQTLLYHLHPKYQGNKEHSLGENRVFLLRLLTFCRLLLKQLKRLLKNRIRRNLSSSYYMVKYRTLVSQLWRKPSLCKCPNYVSYPVRCCTIHLQHHKVSWDAPAFPPTG